jgi:hypothetical protein
LPMMGAFLRTRACSQKNTDGTNIMLGPVIMTHVSIQSYQCFAVASVREGAHHQQPEGLFSHFQGGATTAMRRPAVLDIVGFVLANKL